MVATRSGLSTASAGADGIEICSGRVLRAAGKEAAGPAPAQPEAEAEAEERAGAGPGSVTVTDEEEDELAGPSGSVTEEDEPPEPSSSSEVAQGEEAGGAEQQRAPAVAEESDEESLGVVSSSCGSESEREASSGAESSSSGGSDSESELHSPLGSLAHSMWQALVGSRPGGEALAGSEAGSSAPGGGSSAGGDRGAAGKRRPRQQPDVPAEAAADVAAAAWTPGCRLPAPAKPQGAAKLLSQAVAPLMSKKLREMPTDRRRPRDASGKKQPRPSTLPRPWHELPVTPITEEMKRDLRLLRLRGALDPKRFYKAAERKAFPARFQLGTVIEGPTEFFSGRLPQRQRKATLTEELLADADLTASRKRRFEALQAEHRPRGKVAPRKTGNQRARRRPNKKPRH